MTKEEHEVLSEIRRVMTLETSQFRALWDDPERNPLPKKEADVDAFIRERTRLFRETWVLSPLDELLAKRPT